MMIGSAQHLSNVLTGQDTFADTFKANFVKGVFKGPGYQEGSLTLDTNSKFTSLGSLRVFKGYLGISHTDMREAPNLTHVLGGFSLRESGITYLPNLENATSMFCGAIPVCPKLDRDTQIEVSVEGLAYRYGDVIKRINETPTEELLLLRNEEPYWKHLIDYTLREGPLSHK